ncbi:MAG TPA: rhodanese-like domain-containing protein [Burkholderiales bacterium]|jgi:rhodanese-related sulfurtransferase|nr:rhodanese-like domain-containing protein [Burkholderiales bacterium]
MSLLDFIRNNLLLVAVAVASGAMLVWPYLRRATGGPWVSPTQATQLMNREDAFVIDVREPAEFGAGHVLGARNLPLGRIAAAGADLAKRKSKPVIVYCEVGNRSSGAAAALKKQGFERVFNLAGGMKAWQDAGLPVEK